MALEDDARIVDAIEVGEAHHLVAARIGQERVAARHEAVQASGRRDHLDAGPQEE
jgi:hypothetical protein